MKTYKTINCTYSSRTKDFFGNNLQPLFSGCMAKWISLTIVYPITTVKIRIQENQFISVDNQLNLK